MVFGKINLNFCHDRNTIYNICVYSHVIHENIKITYHIIITMKSIFLPALIMGVAFSSTAQNPRVISQDDFTRTAESTVNGVVSIKVLALPVLPVQCREPIFSEILSLNISLVLPVRVSDNPKRIPGNNNLVSVQG